MPEKKSTKNNTNAKNQRNSRLLQLGKSPLGLISLTINGKYYKANLHKVSYQFTSKTKYLPLSIPATEENRSKALNLIAEMEKMLKIDLDCGCLDLSFEKYRIDFNDFKDATRVKTVREYLEKVDEPYYSLRGKTDVTESTLMEMKLTIEREFRQHLDEILTIKLLFDAVTRKPVDSHARKYLIGYLRIFCRCFQEVDDMLRQHNFHWTQFKCTYEPKARDIPNDDEILEGFYKIMHQKNNTPKWRSVARSYGWAYGILATYGLRSHELKGIDIDASFNDELDMLVIKEEKVGALKTGGRVVFPIRREWVALFGLRDVKKSEMARFELTQCFAGRPIRRSERAKVGKSKICDALSRRFNNKELGFKPYDLRHAYAIRGWRLGFQMQDMAKFMGHTIKMHEKTYQKYMSVEAKAEVFLSTYEFYEEKQRLQKQEITYEALLAENVRLRKQSEELKNQIAAMEAENSVEDI